MAETFNNKYLDLTGLAHFWEKSKTYIDAGDKKVADDAAAALGTAVEAINGSIDDINEKLAALSVNDKTFGDDNKIVLGAGDIEYAEATDDAAAVSVADAIAANATAIEANAEAIGKKIDSVTASTVADEGKEKDVLVSLSSSTDGGAVTVTLDESALQTKLSTIEAAAGVATLSVAGQNGEGTESSLIAVAITKGDVQTDGSSYKGDVTITIDEEALHTKFSDVEDAIKANADAIEANADAIKANGELIAGLVVSVEESADSVENYVSLDVSTTDKKVTIKLDDSALNEALEGVTGDISHLEGLTINGKPAYTTTTTGEGGEATTTKSNAVTIGAGDISYKDGVTVAAAISANEDAIAALASATHFVGVSTTKVTDGGVEKATINGSEHTAQDGDIVIYDQGEFIWSNGAWHLLGDTTAEVARISALEAWVNGTYGTGSVITTDDIDALFNEGAGGETA